MNLFKNHYKLFLLIFCISLSLSANEPAIDDLTINKIHLIHENFKTVEKAFVLSHIPLKEGATYNRLISDQAVRALYETNYFEFVDFKLKQAAESVDLYIHLTSKYKLKRINISGNKALSSDKLLEEGELVGLITLDDYKIDSSTRKMRDLYIKKGYADAEVSFTIDRNPELGSAVVSIVIDEAKKLHLKSINFEGNVAFNAKTLRRVMETKKKDLFSALSGSGYFEKEVFREDIERLRLFYQNKGYLDVKIDLDSVRYDFSKKNKAHILISIEEGQQYFLGSISVEGATIFTSGELLMNQKIKEGSVYSSESIDAYAEEIKEVFTSRGYLETWVYAERKPNLENGAIDIIFKVNESDKYYLESILIEGNSKSKQDVIVRELALKPGDVFDYKRMKSSEIRLMNSGYFDTVRLTPESTNIPGRKDLNILVAESRSGAFSFGAGFGSVSNSQFFLEMKQSNFDIGDWRSGFQGAGQKFRARVSLGKSTNQVLISFEEPWLFGQRLAFGSDVYSTESNYNSSQYNEKRTGFEVSVRRRLVEIIEAELSYRYEIVDIFDVLPFFDLSISDSAPDVFQKAMGEEVVSKVGLTLLRDDRDRMLFTRSGNRSTILAEMAGLGGDVNYFKLDIRSAQFFPTFDLWKQSISVVGRLGTILPWGDDSVAPFYDRFYLGGPETLRGFEYRAIGPLSTDGLNNDGTVKFSDESAGGHSYGLISVEYLFHVAEALGFVTFYDGGFVNEGESDFGFSDYADNIGVGARILMMGSPLKLDYGVPINTPNGVTNDPQFNFSFGTRY